MESGYNEGEKERRSALKCNKISLEDRKIYRFKSKLGGYRTK
jgi:hypothetical protein